MACPSRQSDARPAEDPFGWLPAALDALEVAGLRRALTTFETIHPGRIRLGSRELINFASNDYLALSRDPRLARAAAASATAAGTGATASPLVVGHSPNHRDLEAALARLKGTEAALVFASGYAANVGVLSALPDRADVVLVDRYNHASLLDGAALSGAFTRTYRHASPADLEKQLQRYRRRFKHAYVVTESVFSMDGDVAPLTDLAALCEQYAACLVVDEAHATGVLGEGGRGAVEHFRMDAARVHVILGTLSKALGSQGGFVAATRPVIDWVVNKARSYVFSTALNPPACGAALAAVEILRSDHTLVDRLRALSFQFRERLRDFLVNFDQCSPPTPIIPIILGPPEAAVDMQRRLFEDGFFVPAIRPPSVPRNKARLRVSLSAAHTPEQLEALAQALQRHIRDVLG